MICPVTSACFPSNGLFMFLVLNPCFSAYTRVLFPRPLVRRFLRRFLRHRLADGAGALLGFAGGTDDALSFGGVERVEAVLCLSLAFASGAQTQLGQTQPRKFLPPVGVRNELRGRDEAGQFGQP